jgi:ABC-type sugar transport system permease subunit
MYDQNFFVGFLQYEIVWGRILHDEFTQRTIINSLLYFPVTCGISIPLSILFSYYLFKKVPAHGIFRVIFYLPSILPIAVLTMSFRYMFGQYGLVDAILHAVGIENLPLWWGSSTVTPIMVFVYCVWAGLGFNIVLFSGAMSRVPQEIIEYNRLEGVGYARELLQVMIPMIWPTVATTFIIGMSSVLTVYLQPFFLTGSPATATFNTGTISLSIFNGYATDAQGPYLAAYGLMCTVFIVPFILLSRALMNRCFKDVDY